MPIYKTDGKKDGLQKYRVVVSYTDKDGKYKKKERHVYGMQAAKDMEYKLTNDIKSGEATASRMTVQKLYEEYIQVKSHELRETTLRVQRYRLETHVLVYIGSMRIDKLNASTMQEWKQKLVEYRTKDDNPLSIGSKQSIYRTLNTMLEYAVRMEYIPKNPLANIGNFRDVYTLKPEMDYYTAEEFKKYIAVAKDFALLDDSSIFEWNFYVFFNIAFYTGMRKGEINALKWCDIYDNTIHIRRSIAQKLKGEDRETPPKNKSSIRDIKIPAKLAKILSEHKERFEHINGFSEDWRVCGGTRCLRDSTIDHRNVKFAKAANLKHIRIHDFRHSHASLLANSGINIQEIARRLGHSNVEITWNTYSHLYPAEEERALQVLDAV